MPFVKGQPGGPGRPRKRDKLAGQVAKAEQQIADRLPELVDHLIELAAGVLIEDVDANGGKRVYKRPPDRQANEYLINRIMGKPVDRQEIGEPGAHMPRMGWRFVTVESPPDSSDAQQPVEN